MKTTNFILFAGPKADTGLLIDHYTRELLKLFNEERVLNSDLRVCYPFVSPKGTPVITRDINNDYIIALELNTPEEYDDEEIAKLIERSSTRANININKSALEIKKTQVIDENLILLLEHSPKTMIVLESGSVVSYPVEEILHQLERQMISSALSGSLFSFDWPEGIPEEYRMRLMNLLIFRHQCSDKINRTPEVTDWILSNFVGECKISLSVNIVEELVKFGRSAEELQDMKAWLYSSRRDISAMDVYIRDRKIIGVSWLLRVDDKYPSTYICRIFNESCIDLELDETVLRLIITGQPIPADAPPLKYSTASNKKDDIIGSDDYEEVNTSE